MGVFEPHGGYGCAVRQLVKKAVLFEKRTKNLSAFGIHVAPAFTPKNESFLVLFCKKEHLAFPMTTIRAEPGHRLPARHRRHYGIVRDVRLAWALAGRAVARMPLLFLGVTTGWGAARALCWQGLYQAHLGLGGADTLADFAFWGRVGLCADGVLLGLGPLILAAALMPPVHRLILEAPAPGWPRIVLRAGKTLAALLGLALMVALGVVLWAGLPRLLLGTLGVVSSLLLLVLLLPVAVAAVIAAIRLVIGLPAISLGLPRALAEGWMISRCHVLRAVCVFGLTGLPVSVLGLVWLFGLGDPYGWPATILQPVTDVLAVSLTASVTGLLYRANRLPAALRPDRRPSRNRNQRRQPVFTPPGRTPPSPA
jgi:hypothetical protein